MRKKLLSILALLCLTVTSAWADDPDWLLEGDVWDNGTLTVKSDFERNGFRAIITYDRRNKAAHAIAEMQGKPACFSLH